MSQNPPLVSVVMPAYNSEKYISEAIESILNQSFKNFEFIIVDDCSTDATFKIIDGYAKKDNRIIVLKNKSNLNVAKSRNRGIARAKGKYIATMDSDDEALPSRLQDQWDYLNSGRDIAICIGNINIINENGEFQYTREYPIYDKDLKRKVYRYNPFPNPTTVCLKTVYEKIGGYDSSYALNEDFDFWLRAGVYYKFGNCGKVVLGYRVTSNSASHGRLRLTEKITFKLRWKAYKLGYKYCAGDIIYNLFHLLSYVILPSKAKVVIFNLLRKNKIIR